ncbi:MAG: YitT family protein [Clostridia bacterium]|nr:YitT family protein [Clostridia bacterium]
MSLRNIALCIAGSAILAFGLYHVHSFSGVTEGGILGMTLLLQHWFSISPAVSGFIMNMASYLFGLYMLGLEFIVYSIIGGSAFSLFYAFFERFPPLFPQLAGMPLAAAIVGALFVGVGVGLGVRAGSALSGDDALAMSLMKLWGWRIESVYLISDLSVLALSASYLPLTNLLCSLLTVILSGKIIGVVQRWGIKDK